MTTAFAASPYSENALPGIVHAGFALVDTCKFKFRTIEEAAALSRFAACFFPDPAQAETGLYELLLNAVEHGCLGVGHALKTTLLENGTWEKEILRRQSLPENREKYAEAVAARRADGVFFVVTDPGEGFDWKQWITIDPARAGAAHGRGIARARGISFDTIAYNAAGNQVAAHVRDTPALKW